MRKREIFGNSLDCTVDFRCVRLDIGLHQLPPSRFRRRPIHHRLLRPFSASFAALLVTRVGGLVAASLGSPLRVEARERVTVGLRFGGGVPDLWAVVSFRSFSVSCGAGLREHDICLFYGTQSKRKAGKRSDVSFCLVWLT